MRVGGFGSPFASGAEGLRGLPDEVFHLTGALFKVRVSVRL
jgi:hypothetical protein